MYKKTKEELISTHQKIIDQTLNDQNLSNVKRLYLLQGLALSSIYMIDEAELSATMLSMIELAQQKLWDNLEV